MIEFYNHACMKRIASLCVFGLVFLSSAVAQEKLNADKQIPILAWASLPAGETNIDRFRELKEMGININLSNYSNADAMQKALDLAKEVGIKMVSSCPELKTDVENTVKRFMDHPSLAGYFLRDEPIRKDFAEIGAWAKKIEAVDGKHFCFVNLMASIHTTHTDALGTDSYAAYVRTFAAEVPSQILSFDFYPVLNNGVHENWYAGLEIFSAEARKLQKPFWAFALASSYNALHPTPTVPALRLQLYSNLAYGAQGLEYWTYWMSQGLRSAPIGMDGRRTVVYDRIKSVNREIQNLAAVFVGSKVVSVAHTGVVIPKGTKRLGTLPWAIKVFETHGSGALVSSLENGADSFFIILNRDLEQPMSVTILGDESLKKVLKDGSIVKASLYTPTTEIEPGDIAIFMFPVKK
jgi:hypothetical protein